MKLGGIKVKFKNPLVITVGSQKGGVGKSTIATNLAVAFSQKGYKTELIDTDPQASSMLFRGLRGEIQEKDDIIASQNTTTTLYRDMPTKKGMFDVIIIDTGGRDSQLFRSGLLSSAVMNGVVIIPVIASQFDYSATEKTIEIINEVRFQFEGLRPFLLLNMAQKQVKRTKETYTLLEELASEQKVTLFQNQLSMLSDYKTAVEEGLGVVEFTRKSKAKDEFEVFFKELLKRI